MRKTTTRTAMPAVLAWCCVVTVAASRPERQGDRVYDVTGLRMAVAADRDSGAGAGHGEVRLPAPVERALYDLTLGIFEARTYEGDVKLSSLVGSAGVSRLTIPGRDDLVLYVYSLRHIPTSHHPSFFLLLYEPGTGRVTSSPPGFDSNYPEYCPQRIRFQDIHGDEGVEIMVMRGVHFGSGANRIEMTGLSIEEDLSLRERLTVETGQSFSFDPEGFDRRSTFRVRSVEKLGPERILVTESLSQDKLEPGPHIERVEVYEIGKGGRYERAEMLRDSEERQPE